MRPRRSSFAEYLVEAETESPGFSSRKLCSVEGLGRSGRWPDCHAAVEADVGGASKEKQVGHWQRVHQIIWGKVKWWSATGKDNTTYNEGSFCRIREVDGISEHQKYREDNFCYQLNRFICLIILMVSNFPLTHIIKNLETNNNLKK